VKTVAIVQARTGSTRFPNKVMRPIGGVPMIGLLLGRLSGAKRVDEIVVATTTAARDEVLVQYVRSLGYRVYRGSEPDVLDRYYRAAREAEASVVVRITGDCPLIDAGLVDIVCQRFAEGGVDYVSNVAPPTYPDGLDTEVFSVEALETAWREATGGPEREHVTMYLRESGRFTQLNVVHPEDNSAERWTVDDPADFELVRSIFDHFHPRRDFDWLAVLALRKERPELFVGNSRTVRNEGAALGTGQKLWKRAKGVIPGGNMFLSKRAEIFLPNQWPA
jgi:spore coat polysaccharide biosynthesis protein SpsF (cytidylyltransferase family)